MRGWAAVVVAIAGCNFQPAGAANNDASVDAPHMIDAHDDARHDADDAARLDGAPPPPIAFRQVNDREQMDLGQLTGANKVYYLTSAGDPRYATRTITSYGDIIEDRVVAATGTYDASATENMAGAWVMQLVAFEAP